MTFVRNQFFVLTVVCLLSACATTSFGQTIAGEDFDSGTTNGGFTSATSAVFEGDFDSATKEAHDNTFNGLFDFGVGSRFDRLGKVNATVMDGASFAGSQEGLPFDMVDDSNNGFDADEFGLLSGGVNNTAFALADTLNGSNIDSSGLVSASWTFDISAGSNMQISIDMAAIGDFEGVDNDEEDPDFIMFTYSIDGGATQTAFDVRPEVDGLGADAGVLYSVTMDDGDSFDFYPSPFFDDANWDTLTTTGPFGSVGFHPDDADMDGFVDIEGAFGVSAVKALASGNFNNTEFEAYKDPMIVNGDSATGTILDSNLQTVTVPIVGSGTTLTLKMLGRADGSLEYSVFDNILIEEATGLAGDFDGDGDVDGSDFLEWQRTDGTASGLSDWQSGYASPLSVASAVPEPTTLGLLSLATVLVSIRRHALRA
ncbi:MAG: PEP-CTERM sorting domain-containing protein [Planctomycetes bacterium]|nr:PEP-CTERM sorting domain-containing protein [Planctomycetota bacterium]